jgi:hypothetical protein
MAEAAPGREVAVTFFFACGLAVLKGAWPPQWHLGHCGPMAMPALAAAAQGHGQARSGQGSPDLSSVPRRVALDPDT